MSSILKTRGGRREGAGRPTGSGKYGEPTRAVRIPQSLVEPVQQYLINHYPDHSLFKHLLAQAKNTTKTKQLRPLFSTKVAAGFPSPADNDIETELDLNDHLIHNPASTFFVRAIGDSMRDAGIYPNDLLVVDLSLKAVDGSIVIAILDNEFTVKRLKIESNKKLWLIPENQQYSPIAIHEDMDFRIWGVVTNVIHSVLKK